MKEFGLILMAKFASESSESMEISFHLRMDKFVVLNSCLILTMIEHYFWQCFFVVESVCCILVCFPDKKSLMLYSTSKLIPCYLHISIWENCTRELNTNKLYTRYISITWKSINSLTKLSKIYILVTWYGMDSWHFYLQWVQRRRWIQNKV